MTINLNHPIVASMMARPAKFASDTEMNTVLGSLYGGKLATARDEAMKLCVAFVVDYKGSFAYIRNMKREAIDLALIPDSKMKGCLNVIRSEALAQRDGRTLNAGKFNTDSSIPVHDTGLDITSLEGDYEHNGLWFHVDAPGAGSKWAGWRFVSGGLDEQTFRTINKLSYPKLGSQKPGETFKIKVLDPLMRDAVEKFARETGTSTPRMPKLVVPPTSPAKKQKNPAGDYCARCDHQFPDNAALVRHVNNNHDKQSGYPCTECDAAFGSAAALKDHMAWHGSSSPFVVEAELVVDVAEEPATKRGPSIRDRVRERYHLTD